MDQAHTSMTLFGSSRSPFVRKVLVAAHESGLAERLSVTRVVVAANKPNAEVMAANPLNKIPTLLLADGTALFDSRVICEFFDTLHAGPPLLPTEPAARWRVRRLEALGDGLMELNIARLGEMNRPTGGQSATHLSSFARKISATLDHLEGQCGDLLGSFQLGGIAVACALAHLDFRFAAEDWRARRERLGAWYAEVAARPSMRATEYADIY
ncbi:MAG TPA: glutathione S-transferase N-terminal domain-containing protein [Hyphomicrobiaceae bacterium]|jgi:glutathione S-transferase|nr:glutathione S-transferase N-terminal domain-containing protein [Hyphomicrobiaceae bacterium]